MADGTTEIRAALREQRLRYEQGLANLIVDPATPAEWVPGLVEAMRRIRNGSL